MMKERKKKCELYFMPHQTAEGEASSPQLGANKEYRMVK